MSFSEVFPYPTVTKVIFQIKYSNLLYLESKIGEFQLKIMDKFPDSSEKYRTQVLYAEMGPNSEEKDLFKKVRQEPTSRIWNFTMEDKYELNILSDSLDIVSKIHKTYNNGNGEKFRDIIQYVVDSFLEVTKIVKIKRIGLRYIDSCKFPEKNDEVFQNHFNSIFPKSRFSINDCDEFSAVVLNRKGNHLLRYAEKLEEINGENFLKLDFDGSSYDVNASDYLTVTDELHQLIGDEFQVSIKTPIINQMKGE